MSTVGFSTPGARTPGTSRTPRSKRYNFFKSPLITYSFALTTTYIFNAKGNLTSATLRLMTNPYRIPPCPYCHPLCDASTRPMHTLTVKPHHYHHLTSSICSNYHIICTYILHHNRISRREPQSGPSLLPLACRHSDAVCSQETSTDKDFRA